MNLKYKLELSKRKSISISVKGGELVVKAPLGTSPALAEKLIKKHSAWIEKHIEIEKKRTQQDAALTDDKIAELKRSARTYLNEKTRYYADIMGLKYGRITITSAKTRFGSCSSKRNISYSYRLMLYPETAREYVVVHELAHLVYMNHSAAFYSLVEKYVPDYKERRKLLRFPGLPDGDF